MVILLDERMPPNYVVIRTIVDGITNYCKI